jgi:hypothetical protein
VRATEHDEAEIASWLGASTKEVRKILRAEPRARSSR